MRRFALYLALCFAALSCSGTGIPVPDGPGEERGPYRLTVDGKPFLMLGAQLRTDYLIQLDGREVENLDDYFSLAAGLNITCIQVPVS